MAFEVGTFAFKLCLVMDIAGYFASSTVGLPVLCILASCPSLEVKALLSPGSPLPMDMVSFVNKLKC